MMALAAKMPWYHSTGNRDDGFESSSSASLLHSIYGSQASQLLFSSSSGYVSSESSMPGGSTEKVAASPVASASAAPQGHGMQRTRLLQRSRVRPKSSPVSGIVSRSQRRCEVMAVELTVRRTLVEQYTSEAAQLGGEDRQVSGSPLSPTPPLEREGKPMARGGGRSRQMARRPASAAVGSQRRPPSASHLVGAGQRRPSLSRPKTALGIVSLYTVDFL